IAAALWRDFVQTQTDMPTPRRKRSRQIARCRLSVTNEKFMALTAAPAAKSRREKINAAFVKHTQINRVAAAQLGVGINLVAVRICHVETRRVVRHVERQM